MKASLTTPAQETKSMATGHSGEMDDSSKISSQSTQAPVAWSNSTPPSDPNQGPVQRSLLTMQKLVNQSPVVQRMGKMNEVANASAVANPGGRQKVLQRKWGDFDSSDRIVAREILESVFGDASNTQIGGILEEMIHNGSQKADLQKVLHHLETGFTSATRVQHLVDFLSQDIQDRVPYAQVAISAFPANDAALKDLLNLLQHFKGNFIPVPDISQARVLFQLLSNGFGESEILIGIDRFQKFMPHLKSAKFILNHLKQGGDKASIENAELLIEGNNGLIADAFEFKIQADKIGLYPGLPLPIKIALFKERKAMTTDSLRTKAVGIASQAPDATAASKELKRLAPWAFEPQFADYATQKGMDAGSHLLEAKKEKIKAGAEEARSTARKSYHEKAYGSLTKNQNKALGATPEEAFNAKPPFITNKYFDSGKKQLNRDVEKYAGPDIEQIGMKEEALVQSATDIEAPAEEKKVIAEHQAFFTSVNFHPDAIQFLEITKGDKALAAKMVQYTETNAKIGELITANLPLVNLKRLLAIPVLTLDQILNYGVSKTALTDYATMDERIALLLAMQNSPVSAAKINALAGLLSTLNGFVVDPGASGHLVTLLGHDTPAQIKDQIDECPGPYISKPATIVACRPHAADAATLKDVLEVCKTFGWSQGATSQVLTNNPPGSSVATLKNAVCAAHLANYDKLANFKGWMNMVADLMNIGYVQINIITPFYRMPPLAGAPVTDEEEYVVVNSITNAQIDTFMVHFHPNATGASIQHPNASKSHFKPRSGGKEHIGYHTGPDPIKAATRSRPPG